MDVMQLFHRRHPRDRAAAVRHCSGRGHGAAHPAPDDALATPAVLDAQIGRGKAVRRRPRPCTRCWWGSMSRAISAARGVGWCWASASTPASRSAP
jgi:hypothetical protein